MKGAYEAMFGFGTEEPEYTLLGAVEMYAAGKRALQTRDTIMEGLEALLAPRWSPSATFSLRFARLRLRRGGDQPNLTTIDNDIASHDIAATAPSGITKTAVRFAPNRVYFYDVVSRDEAGNTTVDDNQGNLYSFQTLRAPESGRCAPHASGPTASADAFSAGNRVPTPLR